MYLLENLLNIETLFALSLGGLITFKAVSFSFDSRKQSPSMYGNDNQVTYNNFNLKDNNEFKYMWNILSLVFLFAFPLYSKILVNLLLSLATISPAISLISTTIMIKKHGKERIFDFMYILPILIVSVIAYHSAPYLLYHSQHIQYFYQNISYIVSYFPNVFREVNVLFTILFQFCVSMGFALIFSSLLYVTAAFTRERSFDKVVLFSGNYICFAFIGYLLSCNLLSIYNGNNFNYIKEVVLQPVFSIINFFS